MKELKNKNIEIIEMKEMQHQLVIYIIIINIK